MANKRSVHRSSAKKRGGPRIRFNIWILVAIFALSFATTFVIYMIAANIDDDFFEDRKNVILKQESGISEEAGTSQNEESVTQVQQIVKNPIPESEAADASYFKECCLVTDSTLLGMSDTRMTDILGSEELNAASVSSVKLSSSYGTETVYEILRTKKPKNVYIMLGSDLGTSSPDDMISAYTTLVSNLRNAIPETRVFVMQLPPVYGDMEKNIQINEYNTQLLVMSESLGVFCLDTNTEFKDNEGNLNASFYDAAAGTQNKDFYIKMEEYILKHTVK